MNPTNIREEADASAQEKTINEIFTGIMIADNEFLKNGLKRLVRNNKAGEYYLTDLVEYASKRKLPIGSTEAKELEVFGANNKKNLKAFTALWLH